MEEEFDPEKFDSQMQKLFGDDYFESQDEDEDELKGII